MNDDARGAAQPQILSLMSYCLTHVINTYSRNILSLPRYLSYKKAISIRKPSKFNVSKGMRLSVNYISIEKNSHNELPFFLWSKPLNRENIQQPQVDRLPAHSGEALDQNDKNKQPLDDNFWLCISKN